MHIRTSVVRYTLYVITRVAANSESKTARKLIWWSNMFRASFSYKYKSDPASRDSFPFALSPAIRFNGNWLEGRVDRYRVDKSKGRKPEHEGWGARSQRRWNWSIRQEGLHDSLYREIPGRGVARVTIFARGWSMARDRPWFLLTFPTSTSSARELHF